jgi:hypothetical protein
VLLFSEIHTRDVFLGIVFFYYVLRNDFFCFTYYALRVIQFHWYAFIRLIILVFFFPFINEVLV